MRSDSYIVDPMDREAAAKLYAYVGKLREARRVPAVGWVIIGAWILAEVLAVFRGLWGWAGVLLIEAALFVSFFILVEWLARRQWRHAERTAAINGWSDA
jgi:hypothetical protein